jgi:hypothetical protein
VKRRVCCYPNRVTGSDRDGDRVSRKSANDLITALDDTVPGLTGRAEPLVLEVAVVPEATFAP